VEFIAIPIVHAGITLRKIFEHNIAALSTVRSHVEQAGSSRGITDPATDSNARSHENRLFKSLLDSLTDLAQSRL
jgi:hypothetical protein